MNDCLTIEIEDEGRFPDTRPVMLRNVMLAAREAG